MQIGYTERYRRLGLNIAYYRKLRGFSQEKLAEIVDISRTHMSRIETADCAVSLGCCFVIQFQECGRRHASIFPAGRYAVRRSVQNGRREWRILPDNLRRR